MRTTALLGTAIAAAVLAASCAPLWTTMQDHPCPPGGTKLTYADFGEVFFEEWCVRCHGGPNGYSSRSFTTLASIQAEADRIFDNAAYSNTFMPPGPDGPPPSQREELGEWLACGAPP